jgi:hypothetical protein
MHLFPAPGSTQAHFCIWAKKKEKGGGGGQLEKGEKERKGVFFENAPSPRAPLPSAPTTADARQTQKRPQWGDCSVLQKNKPGGCFGEEGALLLRIFSKKKKTKAGDPRFFTEIRYGRLGETIQISHLATDF